MEDKRSSVGVSPSDASRQSRAKKPQHLDGKPEAYMGASSFQDPQLQSRASKASSRRTNSSSGKFRKKTTRPAVRPTQSSREKLDQKETDAADVPATKHPEQPGESVDSNAPDSQRDKLDRKEAGAADISGVKRPEQSAEPTANKAQERPGAREDDQVQPDPVAVSAPVPTRKPLFKKRRISIFTGFMEKLHSTGKEKITVKAAGKTSADGRLQQRKLDDKALQELLQGAPYQESTSALPANANANLYTRSCYVVGVLFVVAVIVGVMIYLPLMRSRGVCQTPVCRHYAMLLDDTLSDAVPPCLDFHAHVCAGWERSHRTSVIENVYEHFIDRVVEQVSTTTSPQKGQTAVEKAAALFQSCRSIYTGRRSELELIRKRLLDFGIFWPEMTNKSSILRILFSMAAAWNWGSFLHISTWQPGRITVAPTLYFNQTLKRRQAMLSQLKDGNSYQKYFNKMVEAFGRAEGQVPSYEELIDLESTVLPAITKPYNTVPWNIMENAGLEELRAVGMGSIPNEDCEVELRRHFNTTPDGDYIFTITNADFLKAFFRLVKSEGEAKMAYYIGWAIVQPASLLSNAELVNYFYLTEAEAIAGHSQFCVYLTHVYIGLPFYAGYMRTLFTPLINEDVSTLLSTVRESLKARLEEAAPAWNDVDAALPAFNGNDGDVLAALSLFAEAEQDHLDKLYGLFPDMTPSTIINMELITRARRLTDASTEMERFYDSEGSRLYYLKEGGFRLLPSAFEFPVYHPQAPLSIKCSTLGGLITDALIQLLYKAAPSSGNFTAYKKQSCIVNQKGAMESDALLYTLRVTALSMLYDLFVEVSKGAGRLPLDINSVVAEGQLFFIMWCYMQCGDPNAEAKCNAPLKVLGRFHRAFDCERGTPMYPRPECSL